MITKFLIKKKNQVKNHLLVHLQAHHLQAHHLQAHHLQAHLQSHLYHLTKNVKKKNVLFVKINLGNYHQATFRKIVV
jgi:hypothetical protein